MALATLAELKTYTGIPTGTTTDDSLLTTLLNASIRYVNRSTGQVFEPTAATKEYGRDRINGRVLFLDEFLQSVTTLTNGDGTEIPDTDYILLPKNLSAYHTIRLKTNSVGFTFPDGDDSYIELVANFGMYATVPDDIKLAVLRLASFFYRQKDNNSDIDRAINTGDFVILPQSIPNDVKIILSGYRSFI